MFCSKCGKNINNDVKFCPVCGNPVTNVEEINGIITDGASHEKKSNDVNLKNRANPYKGMLIIISALSVCIIGVLIAIFVVYNSRKSFLVISEPDGVMNTVSANGAESDNNMTDVTTASPDTASENNTNIGMNFHEDNNEAISEDIKNPEQAIKDEEPQKNELDETKSQRDDLKIYNDVIKRIISGEELMSDEIDAYEFSYATNPGYALYDIDNDGIYELFVTVDKNSEWHSYSVYYIINGSVEAKSLNGYYPDEGWWTKGFDFAEDAYTFDGNKGFTNAWTLEYPNDFSETQDIYITYDGEQPVPISDDELEQLHSKEKREPADLDWNKLTKDTDLLN